MDRNVCRVYVLYIDCIDIHSIECIRNLMTCIDSIDIHLMLWLVSPQSQLFKTFSDWKLVEYYESYGQKCVDVFCIDHVDIHSIECITCFDPWSWQCWDTQHTMHFHILILCLNSVDIHTMHCLLWSFVSTVSTWEWRSHCTI